MLIRFVSLIAFVLIVECLGKSIMMEKEKTKNPDDENNLDKDTVDDKVKKIDDVAPPKHLDAVKINRDGRINSNFHKEVFLGEDVENFENGNYELKEQKKRLQEIFKMIDSNRDEHLDTQELSTWVLKKTQEHFDEAKHSNGEIFTKLDEDQDGKLTWNEYLVEFLTENGYDRNKAMEKLSKKEEIQLDEDLNEKVDDMRYKWNEVGGEDAKFLNSSQFLDFQHPELSRSMLSLMVDDFMHDMDENDDKVLTVHEYMAVGSEVNVDDVVDDVWAAERRREFREYIDKNKDGLVTREELERYMDPLSEYTADQEAEQLLSFGDENNDSKLSLDELLENSEYYTGSKLYNYARNVHEEF